MVSYPHTLASSLIANKPSADKLCFKCVICFLWRLMETHAQSEHSMSSCQQRGLKIHTFHGCGIPQQESVAKIHWEKDNLHMHAQVYTHTHTHAHMHTRTHTHMCTHTCIHTYLHTHTKESWNRTYLSHHHHVPLTCLYMCKVSLLSHWVENWLALKHT